MKRKPKLLSIYTGAGGLDYGFEAAGFSTSVAVEMDSHCCQTLRHNRRWPVIEANIHDVATTEILETANLEKAEADVLIGGPPCQPFSKSGYWAKGDTSRLDDPRAGTLAAYLKLVEEALPRVFVLENVEGLSYAGKAEGLDFLIKHIRRLNRRAGTRYKPFFRVLRAADYGVPQLRARFFMIASRDGTEFFFPSPTHRPASIDGQQELLSELPIYRTAWDALADVGPLEGEDLQLRGKWASLLSSIPEGKNYLFHTDRGGGLSLFGWRRRYWSFLLKLAKDKPSWTIQAQPGPAIGPFHWENRRLGMRELCRLQTFPDDVEVLGGLGVVQRQLGNAVPSLLAEVLGREILHQLLGWRRSFSPLKLLPIDHSPVPGPDLTSPVAQHYLSLVGDHSSHPGTGKGYRAQARA
ncbi:MAG: DNA cytosine methyltransferase [Deltaproteobacteria bacterium]|nr:DNA cytosine methyltransferase [Deltaproteobacteria bacterium]